MTTCPAGTGSESCCTSLEVPGGTYYRTYDSAADAGEPIGEADPATVSGLRVDKYLVTVGRFRQFRNHGFPYPPYASEGSGVHVHLNSGAGLANSEDPGTYEQGWDATDWSNTTDVDPSDANLESCGASSTWTDPAGSQESLPINCVTWYEAYAFCIWDGGFLPSEAEWEYAAAGGSQQREYPWGSTDPGTSNQYAIYDYYYTADSTDIPPVGYASLGVGLWGQLDMAGEVFEWTLDGYATYVDPCTDCAYLGNASNPVVRGGDFGHDATYLLASGRDADPPLSRGVFLGVRCARTP
jgi:formylglycine-generating enzyme